MTSNKKSTKKNFSISDIPWKWIIIVVVLVIVSIAIIQVIKAFESILDPYTKAIGEIAKQVAQILVPCNQQNDCSKIIGCDRCADNNGCNCDSENKCQKYSSRDVGSGGLFSINCFLGIGLLIFGISSLFLFFSKLVRNKTVDPVLKDSIVASQKDLNSSVTDLVHKTMSDDAKTVDDLKKEGVEITNDIKNQVAKVNINDNKANFIYEIEMTSIGDPKSRQIRADNANKEWKEQRQIIENESKDFPKQVNDIIDKNRTPAPEDPPRIHV